MIRITTHCINRIESRGLSSYVELRGLIDQVEDVIRQDYSNYEQVFVIVGQLKESRYIDGSRGNIIIAKIDPHRGSVPTIFLCEKWQIKQRIAEGIPHLYVKNGSVIKHR